MRKLDTIEKKIKTIQNAHAYYLICETDSGYYVRADDGSTLSGTYQTAEDAEKDVLKRHPGAICILFPEQWAH